MIGTLLLLLSAAGAQAADFELPVTTLTPRIDFRAGQMDYDETGRVVVLSSGAEISDSTFTLRSERIRAELDRQRFYSPVPLEVSDGRTSLRSESGLFDFEKKEGEFRGLTGTVAPWRFTSRKAVMRGRGYRLKGASFTSCDLEPPHYKIRATSLTLVPNVRLYSWNNVFFLGKVPLLYLPFYYRSLRPDPWAVTKFHVGYDNRNGGEIQSDTRIRIVRNQLYDRLYVDYYSLQGWGLGNEINYRRPDGSRGTIYGYRIQERHQDNTRWTMLGDFWQKLGPGPYFLQGRLETLSDPDFNNAYFRSNQLRVSPFLNNSVAVVRQTFKTTTRLSYSRHDSRDPFALDEFRRDSETAPRLDFNAAPFSALGIPALQNFSAFTDRTILQGQHFYNDTAGANWSITKNFKPARRVSFVPTVGFTEFYQDRTADAAGNPLPLEQFTGRYFTQADLRTNTPLGDTTVGHRYRRRLAPNAFREDLTAVDRGEEQNLLTAEQAYLTRSARFAVSSGYDLRRDDRLRTSDRTFRDRLEPILGDVMWSPRYDITFLARETWELGLGHRAALFVADYGFPGENRAGFSVAHNALVPGKVQVGLTFGWLPARSSWTFEGAVRSEVDGQVTRVFEKEITIRKVWHDFITRLMARERPGGVREFMVRVDLHIGKGADEDNRKQQWEQEFYPWRQGLQEK